MNADQHGYLSLSMGLALLALLATSVRILFWKPNGNKNPPMLSDTIPHITNTYQYFAHMNKFLARAASAFQTKKIFGFHLGPKTVFFITGQQNIQSLFRTSPNIGFEYFMLTVIEALWRATPEDLAKFRDDKSGRAATPAPGTENTPKEKRYWYGLHTLMQKYLEQKYYSDALSRTYQCFFSDGQLTQRPVGEWTEVPMVQFLKNEMARAATASLAGTRIFEIVPDLIDLIWAYDKEIVNLLYGPPRWLFPKAHATQRRLLDATRRYKEDAFASFDFNGPDGEVDWEPVFGSRWSREMAKWMIDCGFHPETLPGIISSVILLAGNVNTIPVCIWAVLEMIKDQELLRAIREEAETAYITDIASGKRLLDVHKVVNLPILQSLYVESLRMYVSLNVSREVTKPVEMEGYTLPATSILQAPTGISHFDESVWGVKGHPALEFWAYRNIKFVEQVDAQTGETKKVPVFEMRGRPAHFFPYGGGISICPGRNFAKQEIMLTVAMLASRFDMEFVRWEKMDGTPSDKPAQGDANYAGAGGVPPDRDMRVRWKRLW